MSFGLYLRELPRINMELYQSSVSCTGTRIGLLRNFKNQIATIARF
jgi:hypothetical protein